jgi:hypothetical protein
MPAGVTAAGVMAAAAVAGAGATVGEDIANSGGSSAAAQSMAGSAPALAQEQAAEALIAGVPLPTINTTPYAMPTQYAPVNYTPYLGSASTVASPTADLAQEEGTLGQEQQFANNTWLPTDQLALNASLTANQGAASNAYGQAENSLEARGEGGGGASTVAQMMAQQQAGNADQQSGSQLAQAALQRQLAAITASGGMENQITGQDMSVATQNANILNNFNSQAQNLKTGAAQTAAANTNAASQFNIQNNEAIANANLDRANTLAQTGFSNQMSKAEEQSNAMFGVATGMDQAQAAAAQTAQAAAAGNRANVGLGISGLSALNNATSTPNGGNGTNNTSGNSSGVIGSALSSLFGPSAAPSSSSGVGDNAPSPVDPSTVDPLSVDS